jgi:hypothetical protein
MRSADCDAVAVRQDAQLLESLAPLELRRRKLHVRAQEVGPEGVEADVLEEAGVVFEGVWIGAREK